jgi:hypothetical protein
MTSSSCCAMVMWSPFDPDCRVVAHGYLHVIGVSGSPRSARGIGARRLSPTSRARRSAGPRCSRASAKGEGEAVADLTHGTDRDVVDTAPPIQPQRGKS